MFLRALIFILVVIVILLFMSPELTGMTFAGIAPLVITSKIQININRNLQKVISTYKGKMTNVAEESFANVRTVKAFANEQAEMKRFYESNLVVFKTGREELVLTEQPSVG